jgi:hypothetical protein
MKKQLAVTDESWWKQMTNNGKDNTWEHKNGYFWHAGER